MSQADEEIHETAIPEGWSVMPQVTTSLEPEGSTGQSTARDKFFIENLSAAVSVLCLHVCTDQELHLDY